MLSHHHSRIIAVIIVLVAATLAWISSLGDSPIVDEIPHIGAGYSYVSHGDMRLNPEHPPLVKDLAALPLLTLGLKETAFAGPHWNDEVNGQWTFGRDLIFGSGNNPNTIKNFARAPMFLFFFLGTYFVWRWTRERYDDLAALIALILFAFSPTLLAHTRLVTTDMAAAVGVLVASYFFVRLLRHSTRANFIWAALTLGLALLAKFNTVLLGPYFLLVALFYGLKNQTVLRKMGLTTLVGLVAFVGVVWPVYFLQTLNYPPARQLADTRSILSWQGKGPLTSFVGWAADKPVLRAAGQWGLGLAMVQQRSVDSSVNTIFWLGQVVHTGGPLYFPLVYFLKEPLAWWILVALALTAVAFHKRRPTLETKRGYTEEWVWLLWLVIYWAVSIHSTLNIGVRHLLPIYPFAIMLVAGRLSILLGWLKTHDNFRFKWFSLLIALLLGWYTFESVHVFPHYLTYFNQIAGGPSGGYRYVVDSNLDWGQDAKRLGRWITQNNIPRIHVDYFGWADVGYYLPRQYIWTSSSQWKSAPDFIRRNQSNGWLAISATFLQNSNGERTFPTNDPSNYRWLLDYRPVTVIGNSIFVYHIVK